MKKYLLYIIFAAVALASCDKDPDIITPTDPTKKDTTIVTPTTKVVNVGICPSGISETTLSYYRRSLKEAGADLIVYKDYCWTSAQVTSYINQIDALISPGSTSGDDDKRSTSDNALIQAAIAAGKPVLGICYGHQRLNVVLGGKHSAVTKLAPGSTVKHKYVVDGSNQGLNTQIHHITVDTTSTLYKLLGSSSVMVNSSHEYALDQVSTKLKVVARADDGIVEAVEGDRVMGVQFHPEFLYGKMNIIQFRSIFDHFVKMAYDIKYPSGSN